jgi:hypothetical protein
MLHLLVPLAKMGSFLDESLEFKQGIRYTGHSCSLSMPYPSIILLLSNTHVCDSTAWSQRDCFNNLWLNVGNGYGAEKSHRNLNLALKGTVSRDEYFFWRSKHFIQYFMCLRWWVSRSFKSFSLPYIIINFLFASLKLLTNFEAGCSKDFQN